MGEYVPSMRGRFSERSCSMPLLVKQEMRCCAGGSWNPHSRGSIRFDCVGLLILLYDLWSTPIQLAFQVPIEGHLYVASLMSALYFSACIPIAFKTGFYQRGELKMDPKAIAISY